jgi:hypothetical protein
MGRRAQLRSVRQADTAASATQTIILAGLFILFLAGSLAMLNSVLFAAVGTALAAAARSWGHRARRRHVAAMEPIAVWMIGTFCLFGVSIYFVQFPMTLVSAALIVLGSLILVGAWAVNALPPVTPDAALVTRVSIMSSARFGLMMAATVSVIAAIVFGIARFSGVDDPSFGSRSLLLLLAGYFAAAFFGGMLVGLLRPFARWPLGRMLIGIPVTALIYGCVGAALMLTGDSEAPSTWSETIGIALIIGFLIGPSGALVFYRAVVEGHIPGYRGSVV